MSRVRLPAVLLTGEQHRILDLLMQAKSGEDVSSVSRRLIDESIQLPDRSLQDVQDGITRLEDMLLEIVDEVEAILALCGSQV